MSTIPTPTPEVPKDDPSTKSSLDRLTAIVRHAEQQKENTRYSAELRDELKQKKFTKEELAELAKQFEASNIDTRIKNEARTVILEQMKEDRQSLASSIDPRTWSPQTQRNVAAGVIGGGLLLYLAAKMSNGAAKVVRKVRNTILVAVAGVAILGGAYLGFQAWKNWGEIQKQVAALRKVADKAEQATGEAKEALEREVTEKKKLLDEMIAKQKEEKEKAEREKAEKETTDDEPASAATPENGETAAEKLKREAEELANAEKETAKRAIERKSLEFTARGLLVSNPKRAAEAGVEQQEGHDAVKFALNDETIQSLTFAQLNGINSLEEAGDVLTDATEMQKRAVLFLALVIRDLEPQIRGSMNVTYEGSFDEEAFNNLSLKECIDRIHHVPKLFSRLQESLKGKNWRDAKDFPAIIAGVFTKDSLVDIQTDPAMKESLASLGLEGHETLFFKECFLSGESTSLRDAHKNEKDFSPESRNALTEMRNQLLSDETIDYIKKYLHNRSDENLRYDEALVKHLKENISVLDALQLFMYVRLAHRGNPQDTLRSSNPVGALLTQMKVFDLLGKTEEKLRTNLQADLVGDIMSLDPSIELPEGTAKILHEIALQATAKATDIGLKQAEETWEDFKIYAQQFYKDLPVKEYWPYATTGTVGGIWGFKQLVNVFYRERLLLSEFSGAATNADDIARLAQKYRIPIEEAEKLAEKAVLEASRIHGVDKGKYFMKKYISPIASLKDWAKKRSIMKEFISSFDETTQYNSLLRKIAQHQFLLRPQDVDDVIKLAKTLGVTNFDANTMKMVMASPRAQKIVAGAAWTGDVVEFKRALDMAQRARNLRAGLNVVGAVGDGFGVYMAYCDYVANGERIAETNNPALKELYATANKFYLLEAGTSATGLMIGGVAFVTTLNSGGSVLTAIAAPAGTVMLPIAIIVASGRYYYTSIESAAADWLKESDDWKKLSEGELLQKLNSDFAPGSTNVDQRRLASEAAWYQLGYQTTAQLEKSFDFIQKSNAATRYELHKAYLAKTTSVGRMPQESDAAYQARCEQFLTDELIYVARLTQGTFAALPNQSREDAELWAQLAARGRTARAAGVTDIVSVPQNDGTEKTVDLATFAEKTTITDTVSLIADYKKGVSDPQEFFALFVRTNRLAENTSEATQGIEAVKCMITHKLRHRIYQFQMKTCTPDAQAWLAVKPERAATMQTIFAQELDAKVNAAASHLFSAASKIENFENPDVRKTFDEDIAECETFLDEDPITVYYRNLQREFPSQHANVAKLTENARNADELIEAFAPQLREDANGVFLRSLVQALTDLRSGGTPEGVKNAEQWANLRDVVMGRKGVGSNSETIRLLRERADYLAQKKTVAEAPKEEKDLLMKQLGDLFAPYTENKESAEFYAEFFLKDVMNTKEEGRVTLMQKLNQAARLFTDPNAVREYHGPKTEVAANKMDLIFSPRKLPANSVAFRLILRDQFNLMR